MTVNPTPGLPSGMFELSGIGEASPTSGNGLFGSEVSRMPANERMTLDDLGQVYRAEHRTNDLVAVEWTLWQDVEDLRSDLRSEWERQVAKDPDSLITEGAYRRMGNAQRTVTSLASLRVRKVLGSAYRAFDDRDAEMPANATPEEARLYIEICEAIDRFRHYAFGEVSA